MHSILLLLFLHIQVFIKCGSFSATNKLIALKKPVCTECFGKGDTDVIKFEYIPGVGHVDAVPPLTASNYPTACMAKGIQPEVTISFRGPKSDDGAQFKLRKRSFADDAHL